MARMREKVLVAAPIRLHAHALLRPVLRAARKVLESPLFWAAFLQALSAVAVALIGRQ